MDVQFWKFQNWTLLLSISGNGRPILEIPELDDLAIHFWKLDVYGSNYKLKIDKNIWYNK
jgi:hypothetical protein